MKIPLAVVALSLVLGSPAFADRDDRGGDRDRVLSHEGRGVSAPDYTGGWWQQRTEVRGAPGPIAGAGLPFLAVGYGVYWLIKRRGKT
jgi:hypothetical protein